MKQMKRMIERKTVDNTMPVLDENTSQSHRDRKLKIFAAPTKAWSLNFVSKYNDALNELSRLLLVACIIPGTSLEFGISFSCLKLVGETHFRTTMPDERINRLATLVVLSMHSKRVIEFDLDSH